MRIICQLNKDFDLGEHYINFEEISFNYNKEYIIYINSKAKKLKVKQLDYNISFLYSDKQEIIIEKGKDIYNLTFKQLSYDEKPLYLYKDDIKYTSLDNCTILYDELTCDIDKYQLYKILSYQGEKFCLGEKLDTEGLYIFNSVLDISFRFKDAITKREETVQIGKLLTPTVSKYEFIVYETNIKEITALTSDYFEMSIKSKENENLNNNDNEKLKCFFKKDYFNSLLLFCEATKDGVYSLGQISPQNLENINIYIISLLKNQRMIINLIFLI